MKPICVVPARGGSKRLPRKNIVDLAGKPLVAWVIGAARESGIFAHVYVSTEDDEIKAVAERYGAEIPFRRPRDLAKDSVSAIKAAAHMADTLRKRGERFGTVCISAPTVPLLTARDFCFAYELFRASGADVLYSVCKMDEPPQWALRRSGRWLTPLFEGKSFEKESQDLEPAYRIVGGIQFFRADHLRRNSNTYIADKMIGYVVEPEKGVEIDTAEDLRKAHYYLQRRPAREIEST